MACFRRTTNQARRRGSAGRTTRALHTQHRAPYLSLVGNLPHRHVVDEAVCSRWGLRGSCGLCSQRTVHTTPAHRRLWRKTPAASAGGLWLWHRWGGLRVGALRAFARNAVPSRIQTWAESISERQPVKGNAWCAQWTANRPVQVCACVCVCVRSWGVRTSAAEAWMCWVSWAGFSRRG